MATTTIDKDIADLITKLRCRDAVTFALAERAADALEALMVERYKLARKVKELELTLAQITSDAQGN